MIIHTDGGSRENPGQAATGIVVLNDDGKLVYESGQYLGIATNNTAEYEAVSRALDWLLQEKKTGHFSTPQHIVFKLDSQLVVEQLNGRYAVKQPHILLYVSFNLFRQILNTSRVYPAVSYKFFQYLSCNLAPYRIKP